MKNLIFLIAMFALFACNSAKNVTDKKTINSTNQDTISSDINYRFSVSFISIGSGIDKQSKHKYDQYITEYEQKNKLQLSYETTNWGREGEVDYCFKLTELDKKKQKLFIIETKEILKTSSLVRYKENITCRQNKK
ncbi:MAG: hypothetical protein WCK82_01055 [Bacteroidota bacterium]|jgi:hypothetical protein